MSFLLDTNGVSETFKRASNPGFTSWLRDRNDQFLWISVLTLGELRYGMLLLPAGPKRDMLQAWIAQTQLAYAPRTLNVDAGVALAWSEVAARHRTALRTVSAADELIAATAIVHDLTVVTRNVRDFEASGCKLLSPWT